MKNYKNPLQILPKIEIKETLTNSIYVIIIPKPQKTISRKLRTNIYYIYRKTLNKILTN